MSNGDQGINYQPNSARQGQSQGSTNHILPIPSSPQQQTIPPPPNFSPTNLSVLSTASHQRVVYNPSSHSIPPPSRLSIPIFPLHPTPSSTVPVPPSHSPPPHQMYFSIHPQAPHPRLSYRQMHRLHLPAKRPQPQHLKHPKSFLTIGERKKVRDLVNHFNLFKHVTSYK